MEGIDLFVKILGKGRRKKKFQSLEVREASSSHLKKISKCNRLIAFLIGISL